MRQKLAAAPELQLEMWRDWGRVWAAVFWPLVCIPFLSYWIFIGSFYISDSDYHYLLHVQVSCIENVSYNKQCNSTFSAHSVLKWVVNIYILSKFLSFVFQSLLLSILYHHPPILFFSNCINGCRIFLKMSFDSFIFTLSE